MQINGVGSGHDQSAHHITQCIHNHAQEQTPGAAMQTSPKDENAGQQLADAINENNFSLSAWFGKALDGGRRLFGTVWGGQSGEAVPGREQTEDGRSLPVPVPTADTASEINSAPADKLHGGQIAAASTAHTPIREVSYFRVIEDSASKHQSVMGKVKVKFNRIASYLNHRFSGNNTNQTKKESSGQDLRKRSRYREKEEEIDCILTDDSYLLDSYDSKGVYTRLTTKNR